MKKILKVIALIVALLFTLGPALKGAAGLLHGTEGLWGTLAVIAFVALVVCLVRVIERGNKTDEQPNP